MGVLKKVSTEIQCVALCGGDKNHRPRYVRATLPFLPRFCKTRKGRKAPQAPNPNPQTPNRRKRAQKRHNGVAEKSGPFLKIKY